MGKKRKEEQGVSLQSDAVEKETEEEAKLERRLLFTSIAVCGAYDSSSNNIGCSCEKGDA